MPVVERARWEQIEESDRGNSPLGDEGKASMAAGDRDRQDLTDALRDDAVFGGALQIRQRRRGYRFNIDALWLAAAARPHARGVICDLGAGSGVVGLALGLVPEVSRVILVERQAGLAELCRHNARQLAGRARVQVEQRDLRTFSELEPVDLVVCNPPYFAPERSRPARDPEVDQARRMLHGDLADFAHTASRLLGPSGSWVMVLPWVPLDEVAPLCRREGLHVDSYRLVHARPGQQARVMLLTVRLEGRGEPRCLPPLVEADAAGDESECAALLRQSNWLTGSAVLGPLSL